MDCKVRIHKSDGVVEKTVQTGTNLLSFLRENSILVSTPCGGKGTCGKCKVKVSGLTNEPSEKEKHLLGDKSLEKGLRLACYNSIRSDLDVYVEDNIEQASIVTAGRERSIKLNPLMSKKYFELSIPDLHDQMSDMERVLLASGAAETDNFIELLRNIPEIVREKNFKISCVYMDSKLVGVEPGDTTGKFYGIAVDIGTTTVAAYLYDLATGEKLGVHSMLNPQRKFGADVLSRIEYTMGSRESKDEMNRTIINCINEIANHFVSEQNVEISDIYTVVLVGNTTMTHFLMNVSAKNIAVSPFTPATTQLHKFKAKDLGININSNGYAVVFPAVSGYIGADTVAAVLSSGMYEKDEIALIIDIGTNGEIVLGNNKWMYSCSTAAGPAFEGANIRNGVGGIKGAIDKVFFDSGVAFTTIGKEKPLGICGSGIVDAIAGMLSAEVIDETGRIPGEDEVEDVPEAYRNRIVNIDGLNSLMLVPSDESAVDVDIAVTQKDIRELQNAKAAIAAGIKTLVKRAGIRIEEVDKVFLAGGFGSYINIDSALKIGLIPKELKGKIESIGNAAGAGAIEGLLSVDMLKDTEIIKDRIKYIELSASPDFVDEYVESMLFAD
jgi:uncharacterized 2Fe-2S/4Fe-4S cluster protein (DUF4445 family)